MRSSVAGNAYSPTTLVTIAHTTTHLDGSTPVLMCIRSRCRRRSTTCGVTDTARTSEASSAGATATRAPNAPVSRATPMSTCDATPRTMPSAPRTCRKEMREKSSSTHALRMVMTTTVRRQTIVAASNTHVGARTLTQRHSFSASTCTASTMSWARMQATVSAAAKEVTESTALTPMDCMRGVVSPSTMRRPSSPCMSYARRFTGSLSTS
mmetsp:Transcript_4667/g.14802  ORF Transcript_4667/g.14802 Transcript_4667/m.14802 type:complete len:210 (+) Transcript_4667:359-988(+)